MQEFLNEEKYQKKYYAERLAARAKLDEEQRPTRERCKKDAIVFGSTSLGFLLVGLLMAYLSKYVENGGPGLNPMEVMAAVMCSASGVLGFWASVKILGS